MRKYLMRDLQIVDARCNGLSLEQLATKFVLTVRTVRRILKKHKNELKILDPLKYSTVAEVNNHPYVLHAILEGEPLRSISERSGISLQLLHKYQRVL